MATERVSMTDETRVDDLTADQLWELLTQEGGPRDGHLAAVLQDFVQDLGGLKNAQAALTALSELEQTA